LSISNLASMCQLNCLPYSPLFLSELLVWP
jgi:hypothetical protein